MAVREGILSRPDAPDVLVTAGGPLVAEGGDADHPLKQFVWDLRYVDAPVLRFHDGDTDGTIDDTLYYTTDANMNVTALVDTDGTVVERYVYDAYGRVPFLAADWSLQENGDVDGIASNYANTVLYAGYRFDPETGLYHVRHRMYHPTLGRWIQRDPAGYSDSASFYQYVVSAPVNARDPSGLRVVGSVECPGGEWYVTGTKTGGHLVAIGYSSTIVTLTCKQRKHVATEEWCHEGHTIARRKVWEVPTVKGRMHSLTAGPGIGTQRSKVFGEISGAESSRDFGKYSGSVGAQGTLGVVGGEVSIGPGSHSAGGGWATGFGVAAGGTATRFTLYSVSTATVKEPLGIGEYAAINSGPAKRCWVAVANPKWEPNTDPPLLDLF